MVTISVGEYSVNISPPPNHPRQLKDIVPLRLEHIKHFSDKNNPSGRGRQTASSRGYDTERLVAEIYDGTRENTEPWYDVVATVPPKDTLEDYDVPKLIECKCCIDKHPCGQEGTFRIWRENHDRLVDAEIYFDPERHFGPENPVSDYIQVYYEFLIYTLIDGQAVEVGKILAWAEFVDALIDDWQYMNHNTMGRKFFVDIPWTTLLDGFNISPFRLRDESVAVPYPEDAPEGAEIQIRQLPIQVAKPSDAVVWSG